MATRSFVAVASLAFLGVACGGSPTPTAATSPSPTSDSRTAAYVAMVKAFWDGEVAADGMQGNVNLASRACLGTLTANSPRDATLVDPAACRARAVLILANHQKFHNADENTSPPPRFAQDDKVFETQIPLAIEALQALISATDTGSKQATFDAANTYADIMVTTIVPALDDVDPSTKHY